MSDNGLPPALTKVLACLEILIRRLRARASNYSDEVETHPLSSLRLAPAWPAADAAGPPPELVAGPSRTVAASPWSRPVLCPGDAIPGPGAVPDPGNAFPGPGAVPDPGNASPGPGSILHPCAASPGHPCPGPGPISRPPTSLQDPPSYHSLQTVKEAAATVEEVVQEDGKVDCGTVEEDAVAAMPNSEYADLRAILWHCCGCGWACRTTFRGLRTHQAQGGCGWDSDFTRMAILRSSKAVRPTRLTRMQKAYVKKDYMPSKLDIRPTSPAVLHSATLTGARAEDQAHVEDQLDATSAQ